MFAVPFTTGTYTSQVRSCVCSEDNACWNVVVPVLWRPAWKTRFTERSRGMSSRDAPWLWRNRTDGNRSRIETFRPAAALRRPRADRPWRIRQLGDDAGESDARSEVCGWRWSNHVPANVFPRLSPTRGIHPRAPCRWNGRSDVRVPEGVVSSCTSFAMTTPRSRWHRNTRGRALDIHSAAAAEPVLREPGLYRRSLDGTHARMGRRRLCGLPGLPCP